MSPSDNVIDFTSYRKRRESRRMAELMWTMYAVRTGYAVAHFTPTAKPGETRQA